MTSGGADGYGFRGTNASPAGTVFMSYIPELEKSDSLLPLYKRLGSMDSFIQDQLFVLETQIFSAVLLLPC